MEYDWNGAKHRQRTIAIRIVIVTVITLGALAAVPLSRMM